PVAYADSVAAHDALEQRRLARAVRPDESDVLAALEREAHSAQQLSLADADVESVRLDHDPPAPRRFQEVEAQRAALALQQRDLVRRDAALLLEPSDVRQLRLRLPRLLLLVAEPFHEAFEPFDVGL